jgi:hypothetical protein
MLDHGVEDYLVGHALVEETQFRGGELRPKVGDGMKG